MLQTSLDAYTREASRQTVLHSLLHQHIQDQFNATYVACYRAVRDGNAPVMPEKEAE